MNIDKLGLIDFINRFSMSNSYVLIKSELEKSSIAVFDSFPTRNIVGKVMSKKFVLPIKHSVLISDPKKLKSAISSIPDNTLEFNSNLESRFFEFSSDSIKYRSSFSFPDSSLLPVPGEMNEQKMQKLFSSSYHKSFMNLLFRMSSSIGEKNLKFYYKNSSDPVMILGSDSNEFLLSTKSFEYNLHDSEISEFECFFSLQDLQSICNANANFDFLEFSIYTKPKCLKLEFEDENFNCTYYISAINQNR